MKKCKCGETDSNQFGKDKNKHDGLKTSCRACRNKANNTSRTASPENHRKVNLAYARSPHGKALQRSNNLRRKYWPNMTNDQAVAEYNRLFEEQGGSCGLCNRHQSNLDHTLHVDHCKYTGIIRGLLCMRCSRIFVQDKSFYEVEQLMNYFVKYHRKIEENNPNSSST